MYFNKNLKSLLFDFRSDINYIMWLIISILKCFNCINNRNSFKDYRKIGFIIQLIYDNECLRFFVKLLRKERLELDELQKLSACLLNSKLEEKNINAALIILDKKGIINFVKTKKRVNVFSEELNKFSEIKQYKGNFDLILSVKQELYDLNFDDILNNINMLILEEKDA